MENESAEQWQRADDEVRKNLPPGVKLVRTLRGHTEEINRIAWSHDGRIIASPSDDKTIGLWDAETGSLLHYLEGHEEKVYSAVFAPSGDELVSTSSDGTIRLWNAKNFNQIRSIKGGQTTVSRVAFDPSGRIFTGWTEDKKVKSWRAASGKSTSYIINQESDLNQKHIPSVFDVAFDRNGKTLAFASGDGWIYLLNTHSGGFRITKSRWSP